MRFSSHTPTRGFSLIEVLIYVALIATGFVAAAFVVQAGFQARSVALAQVRLFDAERVVDWTLSDRLEESDNVLTPASGTDTTLQITSPTADEDPVTFTVSGESLTMQLGTGTPGALTPDQVRVTNFSATRLSGSPASVIITVTLETDAISTVISRTSTITYTLRYGDE